MHSSGSMLYTTIERIRTFLDDPSVDAKYDNDFLVRHVISPEMVNIVSALNSLRDDPLVIRLDLSGLSDSTEYFELPPGVGNIVRIAKLNADNQIDDDIARRDDSDPRGPGWSVEGRELHIRPQLESGDTGSGYALWYVPSGDLVPHYSADGGTLASGKLVLTLDSSPDIGDVDYRESAYVGGILRVWNTADTVVEERVISAYDASQAKVTVRTAFSDVEVAGSRKYEIVPTYMSNIWQAVAVSGAINLGVARNITEKQMAFLQKQLETTLQGISSTFGNLYPGKQTAPENSVLYTLLQRVRWGLPEKAEEELSNDYIMRSAVIPKLSEIMNTVNSRSDSPIVVRYSLTLVDDQEYYVLPPTVHRVLKVTKLTGGMVTDEIRRRKDNDPNGPGWNVEGNRLSLRPTPQTGDLSSYEVWYVPSGDFQPHYAKDGSLATGTVLTLTTGGIFSRQLGTVDKRDSGYLGATLRVTNTDGSIEERTITAHDAGAGTVTVTEVFTTTTGTVAYEIVPNWMQTIMSAVVASSVLTLSALKGKLSEGDLAVLMDADKDAMKATLSNIRSTNRAQDITPKRESILHMILEKTRTSLERVAVDLNYSDDYIFRHGIVPEYGRVMSRIMNSASNPVLATQTISLVKDQRYYTIPAGVGEVVRLVELYDDGRVKGELIPRGEFNPRGPGWSIEGIRLSFRPYPQQAKDYELWYIPSFDVVPHYAEDGTLESSRDTLTFGGLTERQIWSSQMLGDVDRRNGAYTGCVLRIFGTNDGVEERQITAHDNTAGDITTPDGFQMAAGTVKYEVVPSHMFAVQDAVCASAIMNLAASSKSVSKSQHAMLVHNFRSAMKTSMDHFTFMQNRVPKHYDKKTVDNENRNHWIVP